MKFNAEKSEEDGAEEITFLYEVGEGVAHRSYGMNVARLANIPKAVLDTATLKSHELEMNVKQKKLAGLSRLMSNTIASEEGNLDQLDQLVLGIEQL